MKSESVKFSLFFLHSESNFSEKVSVKLSFLQLVRAALVFVLALPSDTGLPLTLVFVALFLFILFISDKVAGSCILKRFLSQMNGRKYILHGMQLLRMQCTSGLPLTSQFLLLFVACPALTIILAYARAYMPVTWAYGRQCPYQKMLLRSSLVQSQTQLRLKKV